MKKTLLAFGGALGGIILGGIVENQAASFIAPGVEYNSSGARMATRWSLQAALAVAFVRWVQ